MRVLRAKAARKALHFYKVTHGIRDPYTLLVDGTFVHHALVGVKTNLASRVEKVLGRDVRYAVPGPVLDDLRNRGEAGAAALEFCRRRCRVIATPRACDTVAKAVLHLVGEANGQKFVVATHDRVLQSALRRVPGAPLLYFSGTVLNVDEPSREARSAAGSCRATTYPRIRPWRWPPSAAYAHVRSSHGQPCSWAYCRQVRWPCAAPRTRASE